MLPRLPRVVTIHLTLGNLCNMVYSASPNLSSPVHSCRQCVHLGTTFMRQIETSLVCTWHNIRSVTGVCKVKHAAPVPCNTIDTCLRMCLNSRSCFPEAAVTNGADTGLQMLVGSQQSRARGCLSMQGLVIVKNLVTPKRS